MFSHILPALGLLGLFGWVYFRYLAPGFRRLRAYIDELSTCGCLPPPPSPRAVRFLYNFARVVTWIQVGKVKTIGLENLNLPGPKMVTPNHPHYVDPGVIVLLLNRQPARYMAARGVFRFGFGLGSLIAAPTGAFPVDLTPGKGGPAREAGVRVLTSGQTLVMFPEGWAYLDGSLGPFKKGAVRIARQAARQLKDTVHIVPVYLRYGRYPGSWIKKLSPPLEYLFVFLMSWYYRRGVTAVIGKPISSSDLPADDAAATELLKQRIVALDPAQGQA